MKKIYLLLLFLGSLPALQHASFNATPPNIDSLNQKDAELVEAYPHELFARIPDVICKALELLPTYYPSNAYSNDFLHLRTALQQGYTVMFHNLVVLGITNALEIIEQQKTTSPCILQSVLKTYIEALQNNNYLLKKMAALSDLPHQPIKMLRYSEHSMQIA